MFLWKSIRKLKSIQLFYKFTIPTKRHSSSEMALSKDFLKNKIGLNKFNKIFMFEVRIFMD